MTLPLLDALLTDEKFVARVKQNLKLSDQQIDELKRVASLGRGPAFAEPNAEDVDGNGTDAPKRAEEQLRSVLGEQKRENSRHSQTNTGPRATQQKCPATRSRDVERTKRCRLTRA